MPAGTKRSRCEYLTADTVIELGKDLEVNDSIVHKDHVPLVDVVDQAVVVNVDGIELLTAGTADGELHDVPNLEIKFRREVAGADSRTLGVEEDAYRHIKLGSDPPDGRDDLAHPIMLGMAHVEPEDIGSSQDHLAKTLRRLSRGA
jgi:hypothetical protein